jgi:hypothetical protein
LWLEARTDFLVDAWCDFGHLKVKFTEFFELCNDWCASVPAMARRILNLSSQTLLNFD